MFGDSDRMSISSGADRPRSGIARSGLPTRVGDALEPLAVRLSFEQERIWFLERLHPGRAVHNAPVILRLHGRVNLEALESAVRSVVARHEALRTVFTERDGLPVAEVTDGRAISLEISDLSGESEREWRASVAETVLRPFDLRGEPLVRARLIRLDREDYVLALVVHHIAIDRWSFSLLLTELEAYYRAATSTEPVSPLPAPVQYRDYVAWQRASLAVGDLEDDLDYWRRSLAGARATEIAPDRPRPRVPSQNAELVNVLLPPTARASIAQLARSLKVTPFTVFVAAVMTLLVRWTGQDDICVGTPTATRARPEFETAIGMFLNNLVIRADLSGDPTFVEAVRRVRDSLLGTFAHASVPFALLVQELRPVRDISRTPLFQIAVNMTNVREMHLELPGVRSELLSPPAPGSPYDATIYADPVGDSLELAVLFDTGLYERGTMSAFVDQLAELLRAVGSNPNLRLTQYSLVTSASRAFLPNPAEPLVRKWPGSVTEQFAARVREHPGLPAVRGPLTVLSYEELAAAVGRLAADLAQQGVTRGDVVGILARRTPQLVIAILGTLAAGAAFLIIDESHPSARSVAQLRHARPRAWLTIGGATASAVARALDEVGTAYRRALTDDVGTDPTDGRPPWVIPDGTDMAYITFTSGSRGEPKGVVGEHLALSQFIPWSRDEFGFTSADRFSLLSGLSHDPLHRDIFTPLCTGGQICVPDATRLGQPGYLAGWFAEARITVAHLTPATARLIVDSAEPAVASIPHLRLAFFTGEGLRRADLAHFERLFPNARCFNSYGTTETMRAVALREVSASDADPWSVAPVGRGIPGVQVLVRNAAGQLAGVRELGEVVFRSPYLARGYLEGDPGGFEWSAREERAYRSGDLGRYRADGGIDLMGRRDDQVQIRGFRVEPAEVSAALERHQAVLASAVASRPGIDGAPRLVAYVETAPEQQVEEQALRAHARRLLPDHMVPNSYVIMSKLPRNPNGKVDVGALPAPPERLGKSIPPRTPLEQAIAGIWSELLPTSPVGVFDHFFDLGGHSVLAMQFVSRFHSRYGIELSVADVFNEPTVAGLAEAVYRRTPAGAPADGPL